jgi:hypothetical protein
MTSKQILAAVLVTAALPAFAAVQYDERFIGFVGKGDVQSAFDLDNAGLQAAAPGIRFRAQLAGFASWRCVGTNPAGKIIVTQHERAQPVNSAVGFSARRNSQGQVTGFILNGLNANETVYTGIGQCPAAKGWLIQPTLVPDSISYTTLDPMLQVSRDGELWLDLPVTP